MSIKSWESLNLEELCTIKTGDKDANEGNVNGKYPFFTCAQDISYSDDYSFDGQSILIAGNGNFNVKKFDGKFEAYQRTYVLQDLKVDFRYLYYYILGRLPEITKGNRGSTIRYIRIGDIANYPVPFPSFNEQNRIVDKIETLFSEVDAGISNLTLAKRQLEQYRQSLLKHAFEGKLTAKWREEYTEKHGKSLPNADELLEQIKTARQDYYDQQIANWEQAVKSWEKQGKEGAKPRKPSKLEDIKVINKTELSTILPSYWSEQYLESISIISGGLTKNASRKVLEEQVPYLRVANVHANELRLDDISYIGIKESEKPRTLLQENDLLIVEGNGSIEHIGRVALWTGEIHPCYHQNHLIKARIFEIVEPKYILYFLLSATGRERIVKVASSTTGLHTLSLSKVSNLIIPLTSLAEQKQIIELLESKLSDSERLIDDIDTQLKKANLLKTSILHKAFQGKLVPQDPNDPPASELLVQIKAEREAKALTEKQAKQDKAASKSKSAKTPKKSKKAEQVKKEAQITLPL
ncbi:restriction endonuclease subunit S [uncultured Psychrobacter sp.]|uniref:restriction endonuclease subunit S n=1 Tax=uncultured Psychrobacter sp. TaxID=259303 RepID=UPI0034578E77